MFKKFSIIALTALILACNAPAPENHKDNPFFSKYDTPYRVPPFDDIEEDDFIPAFEEGMRQQLAEIEAITEKDAPADFDNTIAALDRSGELLSEVSAVFYALNGSNTNPTLQEIDAEISPKLAAHRDSIRLNPDLFARIKSVHEAKADLDLDREQAFLLDKLYRRYVRSGALLENADQDRLREINQRLSQLAVDFRKKLLAETNDFKLIIEDPANLAGLPPAVVSTAAETASANGHDGAWVFTTHKPSMIPFLTYADNRDLRRQLYQAYTTRGNRDNSNTTTGIMTEIINLRLEKARLLGYSSFAEYQLETRMAGTPERVYELLDRLWDAALPIAKEERRQMQNIIDRSGQDFALASWDWWYYAEKLRKQKYDLDDNELRPYFELDAVREGAFMVANRLYGLTFEKSNDLPKPHPDAQVFVVKEADGSHCAVMYMDFHPRESKRGGAWCGRFRGQSKRDGEEIDPIINLVCNFTKATADTPALLSFDEVQTLFHEFGHALDGMLSNVTYSTRFSSPDFSELPSQIMEHWAMAPEVLKLYAKHYETGETIPDQLIEKISRGTHFNQGFMTVEYLAASLLDMKYHIISEPIQRDINEIEAEFFDEIGLIPEIVSRYRSSYFAHIVGGYAAGYYGYIWSGVLDNDAFEAFRETEIFDQDTARRFRDTILAVNGSADFNDMYVAFRGRDAEIEALLKNRGLLD